MSNATSVRPSKTSSTGLMYNSRWKAAAVVGRIYQCRAARRRVGTVNTRKDNIRKDSLRQGREGNRRISSALGLGEVHGVLSGYWKVGRVAAILRYLPSNSCC